MNYRKKVAKTKLIRETLYLTIQAMPQERGIFRTGGYSNINIVVPEGVEVITSSGVITFKKPALIRVQAFFSL